jgi:predicted enzyme related to lactoylglutathione lyase
MSHPHGSFCFAELHARDVDAAKAFYAAVLGWSTAEAPGSSGAYSFFRLDGRTVAGLRRADGPSRWIPYLAVESVNRTTARAQELHASIVNAPFEMAGIARLAVINDPAGGIVGLWEAQGHDGADVLDETGSMWWAELVTRDVLGAKNFYSGLLDWRPVDTLKYGVFKRGDESVAGILPIGSDWGPVSPYWQVLVAVDDCDGRVERAKSAGGSLIYGPNDIPNAGRAAVLGDPRNAIFVVMQPKDTAAG